MQLQCKVDQCESKIYCKEYCQRHYQQIYHHGDVFVTRSEPRPAVIEGDIAKIPLGIGAKYGYAIVDVEDSSLDKYKWSINRTGYAVSSIKGKYTPLHKLIQATTGKEQVDHKNGDRLDNRRTNLRAVSCSQNQANKKIQSNNKCGYKGVFYLKRDAVYVAAVGNLGKQTRIGHFKTAIEAARAYDKAALIVHGEYARLNNV